MGNETFYPTEYEIGVQALDWITEIVGVRLPEDEGIYCNSFVKCRT